MSPVDPKPRRIEWHEELDARAFRCRFRERNGPGCSVIAAVVGAPILIFLAGVGPRSAGGGLFPTFGVLSMALPLALLGLLALREDRAQLTPHRIFLDHERLRYEDAYGEAEVIATSEIADFTAEGTLVQAVDREGKPLLVLSSTASSFVCERLRAALDHVRAPLTYRA